MDRQIDEHNGNIWHLSIWLEIKNIHIGILVELFCNIYNSRLIEDQQFA